MEFGFGTLPVGVATGDPERATVTIEDEEQSARRITKRWIRQFGRTAAAHVVDAIDERIRCAPDHRSADPVTVYAWSGAVRRGDRRSHLERGPYLALSSSRGSVGLSGLDTVLGLGGAAHPPTGDGARAGWRVDTEFGYGIPFPGATAGTPWFGISLSEGKPEYRLGYRFLFDSGLHLSLAGAFRDRLTTNEPPDYLIMLLLSLR